MSQDLTPKQSLFIDEYLIDFNGTRAAIAAGYSEKTARNIACENLTKPYIQSEIQKRVQKRTQKLEITQERVLTEIARLAFVDPRKFFNEDGSPKKITELDDDTAACLAGMDVSEVYGEDGPIGVVKKYKLADKGQNLERLGRHLKLFTEKVEHSGSVTIVNDIPTPSYDS